MPSASAAGDGRHRSGAGRHAASAHPLDRRVHDRVQPRRGRHRTRRGRRSWLERRAGRELGSASAVADSKQTLLCAYLSAALLLGLLANSLLGWAWADSLAAFVIAGFAVKEGIEAWRGDACTTPVGMLTGEIDDHAHDQHAH